MEITLMHLGEFSLSIKHFEKALSLYDPERHRNDSLRYSQNSGVGMHCHAAWALWFLGRADQAAARMEDGLTLARELSEPSGLAHALFFAGFLHQLRREERMAQEFAEAAVEISAEHGLALYEAMATVTAGWAMAGQGRQEEAIAKMRRGLTAHQANGTALLRPQFLSLFAEVLGKAHQFEESFHVLEEALTLAESNREVYYQAELYRLKGELLLEFADRAAHAAHVTQAEDCFYQAIRIARQQKAKILELRAAMSLVRLHGSYGRRKESQDLLAKIYDGFTEGFDTVDLREAKAMLNSER
jgi:predicted ATPase